MSDPVNEFIAERLRENLGRRGSHVAAHGQGQPQGVWDPGAGLLGPLRLGHARRGLARAGDGTCDAGGESMNRTELDTVLAEHKLWRESGGKAGKRANLVDANLAGANLARANLVRAPLVGGALVGGAPARATRAGAGP